MAYLSIRPGATLAHWYQDDSCWHERRALWRVKEGTWVIVTPDSDVYAEDLRGVPDGPSRVKIKGVHFKYWSRVGGACYKFASPIAESELKALIRRGYEEAALEEGFDSDWRPTEVVVGEDIRDFEEFFGGSFLPRRLRAKQALRHQEPVPDADPGTPRFKLDFIPPADAGSSWRVADPRGGVDLGRRVTPDADTDLALDSDNGVAKVEGHWVRVEKVPDKDLEAWKARRRDELAGIKGNGAGLEDDLGIRIDSKAAASGSEVAKEELEKGKVGEDVRTLWVLYDEQGERHREWRSVIQEASTHSFSDWPYQGPQSTLHISKHMQRHGGDPKLWMQIWMRKHNLSDSDRVVHELRTLVDTLYLAGTYDQLNVGSLGCLESVSRRIQTIVEAFSNSSGPTPDWSHARLYTGQATADDVVSPDLRSWAAKRGKEEVELYQARTKIREARRLGPEVAEAGDGNSEGGAPRGRGRGRAGKGLEAPART